MDVIPIDALREPSADRTHLFNSIIERRRPSALPATTGPHEGTMRLSPGGASNMARASNHKNGQLEEALRSLLQAQANLTQAQATLAQTQATLMANMERLQRESDSRFARIETILLEHSRILEALPDAVRERMGLRPSPPA